jgi:antitoxin component YwqK of YwqJK toxin-antitoxin module
VSEWFEEELGIEDAEQIIMGVSTSNFLLEIARFLGCNPILLVGMDLAYTNDSRYAEGVTVHPGDALEHHVETSRKLERVIAVPGIGGTDVFTTNQWFFEAVFISAFRQRNPEITLINSTEGGMEVPGVQNMPLSQAVGMFDHSVEIQGLFHGAMQNASVHKIDQEKVLSALKKWEASLEACQRCLERMDFQSLYQETAYVYFLDTLNAVFDTISSLRIRKLKWIRDPEEHAKEQQAIKSERSRFLNEYVQGHLQGLLQGLNGFHERERELSRKVDGYRRLEKPVFPVDAKKTSDSHPVTDYYANGKIKTEAFYLDGKLHGPWSFYGDEGQLLYRSYYEEGRREGNCYAYYADGSLYSLLNYRQGELQGQQLYYYSDGTLKTAENYENGLLEGVVQLYYVNGRLKKEQFFSEGCLHGHERVWDEWGKIILEANYENGRAMI